MIERLFSRLGPKALTAITLLAMALQLEGFGWRLVSRAREDLIDRGMYLR